MTRPATPVPLHLQGAYPIPDPRALNLPNPSDPRALGFFPVSWAADARVQGVKKSAVQHPPETKELAWGDPQEVAGGFARRGRSWRHYVAAEKAALAAQEKLRAAQVGFLGVSADETALLGLTANSNCGWVASFQIVHTLWPLVPALAHAQLES